MYKCLGDSPWVCFGCWVFVFCLKECCIDL